MGGLPGRLLLPLGRGRGMPRPYRVVDFIYCNRRKFAPHPSPTVTASPQGGGKKAIRAVYPVGYIIAFRSRAGHAPPLPSGGFYLLQLPQICPSSVTCGDSFPPRGSHTGGLPGRLHYPDGCNGRHICRPYGVPVIFIIKYGRGRSVPCPYCAMIFYCHVGKVAGGMGTKMPARRAGGCVQVR